MHIVLFPDNILVNINKHVLTRTARSSPHHQHPDSNALSLHVEVYVEDSKSLVD